MKDVANYQSYKNTYESFSNRSRYSLHSFSFQKATQILVFQMFLKRRITKIKTRANGMLQITCYEYKIQSCINFCCRCRKSHVWSRTSDYYFFLECSLIHIKLDIARNTMKLTKQNFPKHPRSNEDQVYNDGIKLVFHFGYCWLILGKWR